MSHFLASLNKDLLTQTSSSNSQSSTQPIYVTSLSTPSSLSSKNEPILTSSPNTTLCNKPSTNTSNQLQLINLSKITKTTSCQQPIKTINLMNSSSPVLLTTKLNKSNLLTTIDKIEPKQDNDYHEDTFLSNINEFDSNSSSNMLDDSLTSLQWLQSLNLMKNGVATASSCSLSPNSQTSDKSQNSLDCDLDSATIPAANTLPKESLNLLNKNTTFNIQYPPLSPPLSVQCSTSPQSTCSSVASSTKKRTKKINEHKTVQQQLQHQNSAPAVLQSNNKSPSPIVSTTAVAATAAVTPVSNPASIFRNTSSYFKDREEYRTNSQVKPPYSYSQLIILSMKESKQSKMTLQMIYDWIIGNFSYFKKADPTWQVTFKNSIRHNLSLNKCFRKIARQKDEPGKGGFWTLDPDFERQLDESNFLGPVNQKSQKRKRKNCGAGGDDENAEESKKSKTEFVQFNDLDNNNLLRSDANWSQENKNQYQENNQYNFNYSNSYYYNYPVQYQTQHHHQQPQQQQQQQHTVQQQQQQHQQQHHQSIAQIDIGETFSNSFSNEIIKTLDEDTSLFNFEPGLVNFDIDQLTTDSSCTSNSTPDDLVNEYLKKSSSFGTSQAPDHNELIELFDITSQFNLDENLNASHMINPSIEK